MFWYLSYICGKIEFPEEIQNFVQTDWPLFQDVSMYENTFPFLTNPSLKTGVLYEFLIKY